MTMTPGNKHRWPTTAAVVSTHLRFKCRVKQTPPTPVTLPVELFRNRQKHSRVLDIARTPCVRTASERWFQLSELSEKRKQAKTAPP